MVEVVKYGATGRRKSSVARVNITPGTGKIRINKRSFEDYFPRETDRITILEPLNRTNTLGKVDISVKVTGGGSTGQAGAFRLGLSRALTLFDQAEEQNRPQDHLGVVFSICTLVLGTDAHLCSIGQRCY